jgi:hypothetical protein
MEITPPAIAKAAWQEYRPRPKLVFAGGWLKNCLGLKNCFQLAKE